MRDQNTLDPNQQLMNPSWWAVLNNRDAPFNPGNQLTPWFVGPPMSNGAGLYQALFHSLTDPHAVQGSGVTYDPSNPQYAPFWDRGSANLSLNPSFPRRAYYSRPLILSAGPDQSAGVPVLDETVFAQAPYSTDPNAFLRLLRIESQAAPMSWERSKNFYASTPYNTASPDRVQFGEWGADDVTNQNLQAPGGATQ
jgi:hypothetical protein